MDKLLLVALTTAAVFYSCYPLPANAECKDKPENERYYLDCKDAYQKGQRCSGIYTIKPEGTGGRISLIIQPPFKVYCDMTSDGGGWTVFQFRVNGSQDFFLGWQDYENGFGDLNGEFWLGLSKIHRLTASTNRLRVELGDFDGNTAYAKYSTFRVGNSSSNYTLRVYGYSGTAGDALAYHNGRQFSTRDQDNDNYASGNCAQRYHGAWWYNACKHSNLNGHYYHSGPQSRGDGIVWSHWRGTTRYSMKATEMKLRRV